MEQEAKDIQDRLMLLEAAVSALASALPKEARQQLATGLQALATRDGASARARVLLLALQEGD